MATVFMQLTEGTGDLSDWTSTGNNVAVSTSSVGQTATRTLLFTGGSVFNDYAAKSGIGLTGRISARIRIASFPTATASNVLRISEVANGSSGFITMGVAVTSGGVLQLRTGSGSTSVQLGSNGSTLSVDTWYRITLSYTITNTTTFSAKVFLNGTQDISATSGTLNNGAPAYAAVGWCDRHGTTGNSGGSLYAECVYADNGSGVDDTGDIRLTAKLASASSAFDFDTIIGSAGSHHDYVNNRPISTSTGHAQLGSSQVSETFNTQAISSGDVDLASATIVAHTTWIFAKGEDVTTSVPKATATNSGKSTGTTLTLGAVSVAVGDIAVVAFADIVGGSAPTIADNLGNTWTALTTSTNTVRASKWYSSITTGGSMTATITFGSSAAARGGVLAVWGTPYIGTLDKDVANANDSTTPFDCPSSGTLAQTDELVLGFVFINGPTASIAAATSPSTLIGPGGSTGGNATTNATTAISYREVTATTAVAPQFTGTNRTGVVGTASFRVNRVVAGTPQIISTTGSPAITLSGTAQIYTRIEDSSSFNEGAIGMRSSGSIMNSYLYECGRVFAYIPPTAQEITLTALSGRGTPVNPSTQTGVIVTLAPLSGRYSSVAPQVQVASTITQTPQSIHGTNVTLAITANITASTSPQSITGLAIAPSATANLITTPGAITGQGTLVAPTLSVPINVTPTPEVAEATPVNPTVTADKVVSPGATNTQGTPVAPSATTGSTLSPGSTLATGTSVNPTVVSDKVVFPTAQSTRGTPVGPSTLTGTAFTLSPVGGNGSAINPVAAVSQIAEMNSFLGEGSSVNPTIVANLIVFPGVEVSEGSVLAPAVTIPSTIVPAPQGANGLVVGPVATTNIQVQPSSTPVQLQIVAPDIDTAWITQTSALLALGDDIASVVVTGQTLLASPIGGAGSAVTPSALTGTTLSLSGESADGQLIPPEAQKTTSFSVDPLTSRAQNVTLSLTVGNTLSSAALVTAVTPVGPQGITSWVTTLSATPTQATPTQPEISSNITIADVGEVTRGELISSFVTTGMITTLSANTALMTAANSSILVGTTLTVSAAIAHGSIQEVDASPANRVEPSSLGIETVVASPSVLVDWPVSTSAVSGVSAFVAPVVLSSTVLAPAAFSGEGILGQHSAESALFAELTTTTGEATVVSPVVVPSVDIDPSSLLLTGSTITPTVQTATSASLSAEVVDTVAVAPRAVLTNELSPSALSANVTEQNVVATANIIVSSTAIQSTGSVVAPGLLTDGSLTVPAVGVFGQCVSPVVTGSVLLSLSSVSATSSLVTLDVDAVQLATLGAVEVIASTTTSAIVGGNTLSFSPVSSVASVSLERVKALRLALQVYDLPFTVTRLWGGDFAVTLLVPLAFGATRAWENDIVSVRLSAFEAPSKREEEF